MISRPVRSLSRLVIALSLGLALAACGASRMAGEGATRQDMASASASLDRGAVARQVSRYRLANGRAGLDLDPALNRIAAEHAAAMARAGRMSHTIDGRGFEDRMNASGYRTVRAYENIGAGHSNFAEVFEAWQDSRSHRANMLQRRVSRIGVAAHYAPGGRHEVYWVLIVAEPYEVGIGEGGRWGAPPPTGLAAILRR